MTFIKPILNFFTHNPLRRTTKVGEQAANKIEEFISEYYNANKGLVGGPFMSTQDKLKQIQWHSTHTN